MASVRDIRVREVKEQYWIGIVLLAVLRIGTGTECSLLSHIAGAFCVSGPMLLLATVVPRAFGGGDIKLVFACGLFLGAKVILISTTAAILLAGVYVIIRLMIRSGNRRNAFPFVPFLCAGMGIGMLFAQQIIDWYLGTLL